VLCGETKIQRREDVGQELQKTGWALGYSRPLSSWKAEDESASSLEKMLRLMSNRSYLAQPDRKVAENGGERRRGPHRSEHWSFRRTRNNNSIPSEYGRQQASPASSIKTWTLDGAKGHCHIQGSKQKKKKGEGRKKIDRRDISETVDLLLGRMGRCRVCLQSSQGER